MEQKKTGNRKSSHGYSAKRKRRNMHMFYIALIVVVLIAAIAVTCALLLKVSLVSISGSSVYTQQEILDACTIKTGDNLVVADAKAAEIEIEKKLPYIKEATVTKKFPSKILVNVQANDAVFGFSQGGVYILSDEEFKVLEVKENIPENLCVVNGAILLNPIMGEKCTYLNEEAQKTIEAVLLQMEKCEYDFSKITEISFEDANNVSYTYENRIKVVLGLPTDLEYKLTFSKSIILNEDGKGLTESDIGIFDISLASDTNRGIFQTLESLDDEKVQDESAVENTEPNTENPDDSNENSENENSEDEDDTQNSNE